MKQSTLIWVIGSVVGAATIAVPASAFGFAADRAAAATSYTASALGAAVNIPNVWRETVSDTGEVHGSQQSMQDVGYEHPMVAARALRSLARVDSEGASASTHIGSVEIPGVVSAAAVHSTATASCVSRSGSATVTGLLIDGKAISTGDIGPNASYDLPGLARVVINEQLTPTAHSVIVRAIHVYLATGVEVIIGESSAAAKNCTAVS